MRDFAEDLAAFTDVLRLEAAVIVGLFDGAAASPYASHWTTPTARLDSSLMGALRQPCDQIETLREAWNTLLSRLNGSRDPELVREGLKNTLAQPVPQSLFELLRPGEPKVPGVRVAG